MKMKKVCVCVCERGRRFERGDKDLIQQSYQMR